MILSGAVVVVTLVAATESVSVFSLGFIVHLSLKSRSSGSRHLRRFSSVWAARSILVAAVSLWGLSHLLHLAPSTPLRCKLHVALSLGLLQPAFLAALLFLLHASLCDAAASSPPPHTGRRALLSLLATSSPVFCLQVVVLFFFSGDLAGFLRLPASFWRSSYDSVPAGGVRCSYPLLSTAVFGSFAAGYGVAFAFSAWRAVTVVINKALRLRIRGLAFAVVVSLPAQVVLLAIAGIWRPGHPAHDAASLGAFLAALACAVVGEGVLVIKPIADSLAVWGHCCAWDPFRRSAAVANRGADGGDGSV